MARIVKREPGTGTSRSKAEILEEAVRTEASTGQGVLERWILRSRYLAVKNLISGEREDISRADSDKFSSIFGEVENLHQQVQKPREQVADAEALLDIANSLVMSVKCQGNEGVTASDFVTALLGKFGPQEGALSSESACDLLSWADVGFAVSCVFNKFHGCQTMIGPMNTELKQCKVPVRRRRTTPTASTQPEEITDIGADERTDTDKNMSTMFDILRKRKSVRLENLVLNRSSFAQTVENIFALSFLVKDGRAEIRVDSNGHHLISPRNAPTANAIAAGDVSYDHFIFRFDFKDWELMKDAVALREELMPHRHEHDMPDDPETDPIEDNSQGAGPSTPIRKLSRNRGLVIQEQSVVNDALGKEQSSRGSSERKGKRLLSELTR